MRQYIDIVKHVLNHGKVKKPVRKDPITGKWQSVDGGVSTLACPNVLFSHNMSDGFPLLTTKQMGWKSIRVELAGFIRGITSKRWYKDRGCRIWDEWCNPRQLSGMCFLDNQMRKDAQLQEEDLGPIYGFQWRKFNQCYDADDDGWAADKDSEVAQNADQFANIVRTLRQNPMDRRMVCSAWNPLQMDRMALPPCHWGWNVTVIGDELNLFWVQRSCDLMLGVPFNIASYGLLLELLAFDAGFVPGNLSGMLVDCHIYENQLESANKQILREPYPLPHIEILSNNTLFDIFSWDYADVTLINYQSHPKLDFGGVVV